MVNHVLAAELATDLLLLKIFKWVVFVQKIHFFIVRRYKSLSLNLFPWVLSYPSLRSKRETDPCWVWSRGSKTKLILREESFVSQILCLVHAMIARFHKSKID